MLHRDRGKTVKAGFTGRPGSGNVFAEKREHRRENTGKALHVRACGALFYGCARRLLPFPEQRIPADIRHRRREVFPVRCGFTLSGKSKGEIMTDQGKKTGPLRSAEGISPVYRQQSRIWRE